MKTEVVSGIDIGGTNTRIGLVDKNGVILFSENTSTHAYDTPEKFVKDAAENRGLCDRRFPTLKRCICDRLSSRGAMMAGFAGGTLGLQHGVCITRGRRSDQTVKI